MKDAHEIPYYLREDVNLFCMTQADVEDAFHSLTKKFIKKPLEKYVREWKGSMATNTIRFVGRIFL